MFGRQPSFAYRRIRPLWAPHLRFDRKLLWLPLVFPAGAYRGGLALRSAWWLMMKQRADVPTISVGNLTVGGNGKTPFTLFLASRLRRRGLATAIVSRGYGGSPSRSGALLVSDGGGPSLTPEEAGDEPVMMARSFAGPIAVAARRIDALRLLFERARLDAVVLDDGFQHLRLDRDVDLLLVSRERGVGNGWMLPAGPMREPLGAARRADAVILVTSDPEAPCALSVRQMKLLATRPMLEAALKPRCLVRLESGKWREEPLDVAGQRVLAVSGLADPAAFYAMLRRLDAELVGVLEHPDHHHYTQSDWQAIVAASRTADVIITTEKDLVKLERFPFSRHSLYALRLEAVMGRADAARLDRLILDRIRPLRATASA